MSTQNLTDQALVHTPLYTNDASVMGTYMAWFCGLILQVINHV